jgi:hypothetical protein
MGYRSGRLDRYIAMCSHRHLQVCPKYSHSTSDQRRFTVDLAGSRFSGLEHFHMLLARDRARHRDGGMPPTFGSHPRNIPVPHLPGLHTGVLDKKTKRGSSGEKGQARRWLDAKMLEKSFGRSLDLSCFLCWHCWAPFAASLSSLCWHSHLPKNDLNGPSRFILPRLLWSS